MHLLNQLKNSLRHSPLKKLWHRFAPPVILARTVWDKTVFFSLRDNIDDCTRSRKELEAREPKVLALLELVDGPVWDVGANVGLFSLRSALTGHPTTAFELSPAAAGLLQKMIRKNGIDIQVVARPMTVEPMQYNPPKTSYTENEIGSGSEGSCESISFRDAAAICGIPKLLKMDIEGFEEAFFQCDEFKQWLLGNDIIWIVEVHRAKIGTLPEWPDVAHQEVEDGQLLYGRDETVAALLEKL
jgi:FkbM family methyltransferase